MTCRGFTRKQVFHYLGKHLPSFCFLFSLLTLVTNDEWLNLRQGVRSQGICESWGLQRYRLSVELVPLTNATATCGDTSVDSPLFGRGEFKGCKVTHHYCVCESSYRWLRRRSVKRGDTEAAAMWRDLRAAGIVMYVFSSLTMFFIACSSYGELDTVSSKMKNGLPTHPHDLRAAVFCTIAVALSLVGGMIWWYLAGSARCADLVEARALFAAPNCDISPGRFRVCLISSVLSVAMLFQWLFVWDRVRHDKRQAAIVGQQALANQNQPAAHTIGYAAANPQDDVYYDAESTAGSDV